MKVKAISVYVFRSSLGDCTNGGASGKFDTLYVEHPRGCFEVETSDERLFRVEPNAFGHPVLIPENKPRKAIGPMAGGNYAASSDSRFEEAIRAVTGRGFYGAVAIHDRFETQREYELLSR